MSEHSPAGDVETGAEMDYSEHDKTYAAFLALTKWGVISCVILLVLMAVFLL